MSTPDDSAVPPHLADQLPPRPIPGSTVHFHDGLKCRAAIVVDLLQDDPLAPDYRIDVVVFQPRRPVSSKDKFTNANSLPGNVRWANNLVHAPVEQAQKLTWHYPDAGCVPKVIAEV